MTPITSVLIVDDEPAVRDLMSRWVTSLGLQPKTAADAEEALATLRGHHYDLAVIDVMMPGHDGLWLARQLRCDHPHTAVIIATGYAERLADANRDRATDESPIADFLVKPFQRDRFAQAVERGRQWRRQSLDEVRWHAVLSAELRDRVGQIVATMAARESADPSDAEVLAGIARARAPEARAHGERVAERARAIARALGVDGEIGELLDVAARFHDIGKAAMPDALLGKPSPLTPGERAIMSRHAEAGAEILSATMLRDAAPIVGATHEWFGGGGHPLKLAGAAIPLASRIIAVAAAFDAMTTDRPYRPHLDSVDAVAEILRCSPVQFDPEIVGAFLNVLSRE